jgi:tetratricopeptide (TPR) repeat protein
MNREAVDLLEAVRDAQPFADSIKIMAARQYFALQQLEEAYELISEIMARDPENYHGLILFGEYFFRKGHDELSSNYFHKALVQNSNSYLANYYVGVIHLRSNNIRLSTYFLEKSLQVNPNTLNARLLLGAICLQSHKYALAVEYASTALRIFPGHVGAHLLSGIALYLQGQYEAARYELDVVEVLDPQRPSVKVFHALIELEQHQPKAAEKYISALTASIPEQIFLQAQVLQDYGLEPRHLQQLLDAQVKANHDPVAGLILGHVYYAGADYARAEVAYRRAMGAPRPTALPYYAMAQLEAGRGNRRQAIAYLEQAVVMDPTFPKSYLALGGLYEQEQDYQQARLTYQRGLQHAPQDPTLLNNLAWVHLVLGADLGTAYVHIRKAITLAPEDPDLQDTLAWWYYLAHDYPQAIAVLQKIVKAHPDHALYRYHLGMAYLKSGAREEGQHHLQRALALGIDAEHRRLIQEHTP